MQNDADRVLRGAAAQRALNTQLRAGVCRGEFVTARNDEDDDEASFAPLINGQFMTVRNDEESECRLQYRRIEVWKRLASKVFFSLGQCQRVRFRYNTLQNNGVGGNNGQSQPLGVPDPYAPQHHPQQHAGMLGQQAQREQILKAYMVTFRATDIDAKPYSWEKIRQTLQPHRGSSCYLFVDRSKTVHERKTVQVEVVDPSDP